MTRSLKHYHQMHSAKSQNHHKRAAEPTLRLTGHKPSQFANRPNIIVEAYDLAIVTSVNPPLADYGNLPTSLIRRLEVSRSSPNMLLSMFIALKY